MIVPGSANPLLLGGGEYTIARSLRFRSSASAYLNRTAGASATNQYIATTSIWFKRGALGTTQRLLEGKTALGDTGLMTFQFESNDQLAIWGYATTWRQTSQVFRDPSAWYHLVVTVDTTQATASNRVKVYLNGSQITAFGTSNNPTQNTTFGLNNNSTALRLCTDSFGLSRYFDGYLAEVNFIDGQALTPSSFGETSTETGVWVPKKYTGTYGTNGFYLNFSDNTSATTLAYDKSGNGNNWTANNISTTAGYTYDSMTDVPTLTSATASNFAVLNPIAGLNTTSTISSANLQYQNSSANQNAIGTFQLPSTGKYYWEVALTAIGAGFPLVGLAASSAGNGSTPLLMYIANGNKLDQTASSTSYGSSWTTGDVIGVAVDMDASTLVFYKNNVSQGTAFSSITTLLPNGIYPCLRNNTSSDVMVINFGQRPFAYTPPTGFKALNTFNLPDPVIKKPNQYMDATTYTGNGNPNNTTQTIVNSGSMQPDFVWIKSRSNAYNNSLFDSVRGIANTLASNSTSAEDTTGTTMLTALNSNGFTVGSNLNGSLGSTNVNGATYVGWQWKESATAGFDIVTYTGTGSARTISHNLGVAPKLIICKWRSGGSAQGWPVYHASLGNTDYLALNLTDAKATNSTLWNNTSPTSTDFTVGTNTWTNGNGITYVAYLFAEIPGFSKFGSFSGNGNADGPMVYLGFRPKYVMIKRTDVGGGDWCIHDTSRATYNLDDSMLGADISTAEQVGAGYGIDVLSNGFKLRSAGTGQNANGGTMIYAAFAENPFKYSLAR